MHPLNQRAREVLDQIAAAFDDPESLVDTLTKAALIPNTSPCIKWSPTNRFIVAMKGTSDARGYRQWKQVSRHVKKGSKAIHILVPRFRKSEDDNQEEKTELIGFLSAAVFPIEATDGEPLPGTELKHVPKLQSVADTMGVPVTYAGAVSDEVSGVYVRERADDPNKPGRITLYTKGVNVFYHELSHALHHRLGKIRQGKTKAEKRDNEIVAEVGAAVLVRLFEGEEMGRQAIQYIKAYDAKENHLQKLLPEIMEILDLAIELGSEKQPQRKTA